MSCITSSEDLVAEAKTVHQNILLEIIKEACSNNNNKMSPKLRVKVKRIISECDLSHYTSLHRLNTADETTSTLLGIINQTNIDLNYDEQIELNNAIIQNIQTQLPKFKAELDHLTQGMKDKKSQSQHIKDLQESLDDKLNTLQQQEIEKKDLMMEWLDHRLSDLNQFSSNSSDLLALKTKMLNLKSKILHLHILQNIFTETNQSVKAYSELHKDLKQSVKDAEKRIADFREIIGSDME